MAPPCFAAPSARAVCKEWCALVDDTSFIKLYCSTRGWDFRRFEAKTRKKEARRLARDEVATERLQQPTTDNKQQTTNNRNKTNKQNKQRPAHARVIVQERGYVKRKSLVSAQSCHRR